MTADVMCDPENSSSFRGYLIDSSSLQLYNGAPACPSPNRSFFVMMALSNYSIDAGLYYDTAPNPHLDVPLFADWAAARLGCEGQRVDDAIGSPDASTLRYTYSGPCGYAVGGSRAVVTLGIQNGGHTWYCQDSDAEKTPSSCPGIPNPPGLTPSGLPYTNGLFIEKEFWNFVAQSVSTEASEAPLEDTSPPVVSVTSPSNGSVVSGAVPIQIRASDDTEVASVRLELDGTVLAQPAPAGAEGTYTLSWNTTTATNGSHVLRALATDKAGNLAAASTVVTVANAAGGGGSPGTVNNNLPSPQSLAVNNPPSPSSFVALGDGYSSGEGNSSYLPGSDTPGDRCHRSTDSYPFIASGSLSGGPAGLVFRACSGAKIADFFDTNKRDHEPPQLQWIGGSTRLASLSVGWDDALLPAALRSCVQDSSRCEGRWRARVDAAIRAIGAHSPRKSKSLYTLYRKIAELAPNARVAVFGYPRLFPADPPARCSTGAHARSFTRNSMEWINSEIGRLDGAIKSAAAAAGVDYIGASYEAFGGHERCTPPACCDRCCLLRPRRPRRKLQPERSWRGGAGEAAGESVLRSNPCDREDAASNDRGRPRGAGGAGRWRARQSRLEQLVGHGPLGRGHSADRLCACRATRGQGATRDRPPRLRGHSARDGVVDTVRPAREKAWVHRRLPRLGLAGGQLDPAIGDRLDQLDDRPSGGVRADRPDARICHRVLRGRLRELPLRLPAEQEGGGDRSRGRQHESGALPDLQGLPARLDADYHRQCGCRSLRWLQRAAIRAGGGRKVAGSRRLPTGAAEQLAGTGADESANLDRVCGWERGGTERRRGRRPYLAWPAARIVDPRWQVRRLGGDLGVLRRPSCRLLRKPDARLSSVGSSSATARGRWLTYRSASG